MTERTVLIQNTILIEAWQITAAGMFRVSAKYCMSLCRDRIAQETNANREGMQVRGKPEDAEDRTMRTRRGGMSKRDSQIDWRHGRN